MYRNCTTISLNYIMTTKAFLPSFLPSSIHPTVVLLARLVIWLVLAAISRLPHSEGWQVKSISLCLFSIIDTADIHQKITAISSHIWWCSQSTSQTQLARSIAAKSSVETLTAGLAFQPFMEAFPEECGFATTVLHLVLCLVTCGRLRRRDDL